MLIIIFCLTQDMLRADHSTHKWRFFLNSLLPKSGILPFHQPLRQVLTRHVPSRRIYPQVFSSFLVIHSYPQLSATSITKIGFFNRLKVIHMRGILASFRSMIKLLLIVSAARDSYRKKHGSSVLSEENETLASAVRQEANGSFLAWGKRVTAHHDDSFSFFHTPIHIPKQKNYPYMYE